MPRFNVKHNDKWACFTTVSDGFITEFMPQSEYQEWRLSEYGKYYGKIESANTMTLYKAVQNMALYHGWKQACLSLLEALGEYREGE